MTPNIFDYTDAAAFLRDTYAERRKLNSRFSLRAWSKQLAIKNPSTLSRILKGDRAIGLGLLQKLAKGLKLSERQRKYFEVMVMKRRAGADYTTHLNAIKTLDVQNQSTVLSPDQFAFISEWYHGAILEMTSLTGFKADPHWISARLGGTVAPEQCSDALNRLEKLGLIKILSNKKIERFSDKQVFSGDVDIPCQVIRRYHKTMLQKAVQSIEGQPLDQRFLEGITLSLRASDIMVAKRIIQETTQKLSQLTVNSGADAVFHVSTQLFQLTSQEPSA